MSADDDVLAGLGLLSGAGWYWQMRYVPGEGYDLMLGRPGAGATAVVGHATPEAAWREALLGSPEAAACVARGCVG